MFENIKETALWLKNNTHDVPEVAIILGSGLGVLRESMDIQWTCPYAQVPHFPVSTVEGHAGRLLFGTLRGHKVAMMDGRFHYYEGYTMQEVTFPVRVLREWGARCLFVSNAAGGVNPSFSTGDLMLLSDHINFLPEHPLRGKNCPQGPRFPGMEDAYDSKLRHICREAAKKRGITLKEGVYLADSGPSYETPAEYRMYRLFGADAVGMSTVPEVIVACHCGLRTLGMSVITNAMGGKEQSGVNHEEVQAVAQRAGRQMALLMGDVIAAI